MQFRRTLFFLCGPAVGATRFKTCQLYLIINVYLAFVSRTVCDAEQAVLASTCMAQVQQQPLCYPEDEEEEIYISESMQEITDGILVF